MMSQDSRFGAPSVNPLLRALRRLAEQSTEAGMADALAEAAEVVGLVRITLAPEDGARAWQAREIHVPIPGTTRFLVATSAAEPSHTTVEYLHALASTASLVVRSCARDREAERSRFHITLGRGAAGVVHDIANPLHALQLSLEAVRDGVDVADALEDAFAATNLMRSALDRIRTFSGVFDAHPTVVDVGAAIAVALKISSFATRGQAEVVVRALPGLTTLARAGEVEHVLVNVIINAAQAVAGSGGFHHRITVTADARGPNVVIAVRDTGPGIAAGGLARLFDEGFTTKASRAGAGLGLALCRDIVEKLGGRISIESVPREGTAVTISLPSAGHDATGPRSSSVVAASARARRPRVLLVESDDLVARALTRSLQHVADVTRADSTARATELIASESFDLVLCEHGSPYVDALAVRNEQEKRGPGEANRVIVMLGDPAVELPAGVRVIAKPVDVAALRALVER